MGEKCAGECNYELGGVLGNINVNIILWHRREWIGQCPEIIAAGDMRSLIHRRDRAILCHGARLLGGF